MKSAASTDAANKPSWLEEVWMEVQAEIDTEELGERMDDGICLHGHYEEKCPDCNESW